MKKEISASHLDLKGLARLFGRGDGKVDGSMYLTHMLLCAGGEICLSTAGAIVKSLYHVSECSLGEKIPCVFIRTAPLFQQKGLRRVLNI